MTIGWMCAVTVLCAVLYLLGWERGHRGATVWRSVKRALAARRQRLERATPGGAGRKGARPAEAAPAWGKPQMAAPGGATEAGVTEAGAAGRSTAPTGARAAAGKAGRGAAGRGAADNRNPAGRGAAGTNAAGRNTAGADPAQAGAGTQAGRNTGEPANGRALQELLNFLQYDGTPQPPPGGHNR